MKHIPIVFFMLGVASSIFGTFIINRTITIDAVTLATMRGSSLPASHLFDPYIDNLSDANSVLFHDAVTTDLTRDVPETINPHTKLQIVSTWTFQPITLSINMI